MHLNCKVLRRIRNINKKLTKKETKLKKAGFFDRNQSSDENLF